MTKIFGFLIFLGLFSLTLQVSCGRINDEGNKNPEKERSNIKVTFVELGSVKCIPCKKMQPIMDEIEKEYKDQVKVVFHDVWTSEGKPFAGKYKIRLIPTQVFLDSEGKEYFRHEGFFPKEDIIKILKKKGVE
ncbi:MAG: thioredoxin family protein [Candidatus Aminicenantes bacterium]|nr:thioredoxin family protein [Candidatus Aminicenantes bacterium]MCK5003874.1 thioredoxin family protein [Candidatus Aminicenantes bacterium]